MRRLLKTLLILCGLASCGPTGCLARGTRVRVPGGTRRIEDLEVGDEVLCADPATGTLHVAKLSATQSVMRECLSLTLPGSELVLTTDHPVYCPDSGEWAPAGDWVTGKRHTLLGVAAETLARVTVHHSVAYVGIREVFDLTVDHPLHNFIAEGVLVHNKQRACINAPDGGLRGTACVCADGGTGSFECLAESTVECDCH